MSARDDILASLRQLDESQPGDMTPEELVDAHGAEVLRAAAERLVRRYGPTNRAASLLHHWADDLAEGGGV